jgi:phosphoribosylanthranilate isomerase
MKIKVCGMKYPENISEVAALQPDFMGFICYERSPRHVGDTDLLDTSPGIIRTGVFVNAGEETIKSLIDRCNFGAIQLHGDERPEFCDLFKDKVTVIKAFGVDEAFDFEQLSEFEESVDYFLFDTKTSKHGGSGLTFDWKLLDNYTLDIPFFLSGGLSPENIEEIKAIDHPQFYGVDLNSKFEIVPGLKDIVKLEKAFGVLRDERS